ncbi:putative conserved hypothetical protein, partial [Colletotrichum sublineola]
ELLSYLSFIYETWLQVVGGNEAELEKIDWVTVEAIQLRCPRFSASDERALRSVILRGDAFKNFSHAERLTVLAKLCSFDFPIPSLSTFFRDFRYLEECGNFIKRLVPFIRGGPTIRRLLLQNFNPSALREQSESTPMARFDYLETQFELGIRHLWLFTMREFHSIHTDPGILPRFARLAFDLGFDTDEIRSLKRLSPHREIARHAMVLARSSQDRDHNITDDETAVDQIVKALPGRHGSQKQNYSAFTTNVTTMKLNSRPWIDLKAYSMDAPNLVVEILDRQPLVKKKEVTSLFFLRSIYRAIFREDLEDFSDQFIERTGEMGEANYEEANQPANNQAMEEDQDFTTTKEQVNRTTGVQSKKPGGTQTAKLKIMKMGILREEQHLNIDITDENEPKRVEKIVKQLMVEHKILPFSLKGYPLLAKECYKEIVQEGHECVYMTDGGRFTI